MQNLPHLTRLFHEMRAWTSDAGFDWEVNWQRTRNLEAVTEQEFLRETAWVILCSGFRAAVVREKFDHISLCFCDWESADAIQSQSELCIATASVVFCNKPKMRAIAQVAAFVARWGFPSVLERLRRDVLSTLQELPYIGPVTSMHLAKNLGFPTPKPDRHLVRLARHLRCKSTFELCDLVAGATGEPISVVDVVMWRFMERGGPLDAITSRSLAEARSPQ